MCCLFLTPTAPRTPYDHADVGRRIYLKQCKELGVTPIGYFMRHIADNELCLRNYSFGPVGAHALAVPLMVNITLYIFIPAESNYNILHSESIKE